MVLVYKARDITEAHIVSGLLKSNGIEAHVSGHYLQGGVGELAPMDFANVHVDDDDIKQASLIIDKYENDQYSYQGRSRNYFFLTPRLLIAISAILIMIFIYALATS